MKNNIIILCLAALILTITSCKESTINESTTAVTFLVDVTEQSVFDEIDNDFHQNLNAFFTNTGICKIDLGQRITIRMGAIDECDQLTLQSRSIALTNPNASQREREMMRNPRPLVEMISTELARYKQLSEKQKNSPIIDVTLKTFREMDSGTREILVICTDGLEFNTKYANFYKDIPTTEQTVEKLISKIDPILLAEAKEKIAATNPEVVIVLKPNDKMKKTTELKQFYSEFMHQIGVNTVRFIDNLSNNPNL